MSHDQDMLLAAGTEAERTRDSRSDEKSRSFRSHEETQSSGVSYTGLQKTGYFFCASKTTRQFESKKWYRVG